MISLPSTSSRFAIWAVAPIPNCAHSGRSRARLEGLGNIGSSPVLARAATLPHDVSLRCRTLRTVTFAELIAKWQESGGAERANKDSFLNDLCDALEVERPRPTTGNPDADLFVFERDALIPHENGKVTIGKIDLYKHGYFILEAKQGSESGSKKVGTATRGSPRWNIEMRDAFGQALGYAKTLDDPPPFIITCDIGHCFDLYATFDSTWNYRPFPDALSSRIHFADIARHADRLRTIFTDPFALDPSKQASKVTREIAAHVATLARLLEEEGHDPTRVAQFLMRCLFTMFAEDIDLLPRETFVRSLQRWIDDPVSFVPEVETLWQMMNQGGALPLIGRILRFNGGLFADPTAIPLSKEQLILLGYAAASNWSEVEPAIFGTLLERALNPKERHRLGAHYTPRAYVERLVRPTIEEPLREEWEIVQAEVRQIIAGGKADDDRKAMVAARKPVYAFYDRLRKLRILDPACGSGNFLFVALDLLKRLENEILDLLHDLGDMAVFVTHGDPISPEQFLGIEVKAWAKEITELVLWIGYLQWQIRTRGWKTHVPEPVLTDYENIELRDAVLEWDDRVPVADDDGRPATRWDSATTKLHPVTGKEVPDGSAQVQVYRYLNPRKARWPRADFVVGNPPFIGNKRMRAVLGDDYVEALRTAHDDVAETADYVMYWWNHAAHLLRKGEIRRFGLITTNSVTQVFNRRVLQAHLDVDDPLSIMFAVPDHPWVDSADGAAVRVAMTAAAPGRAEGRLVEVEEEEESGDDAVNVTVRERRGYLHADLRIGTDLSKMESLQANTSIAFRGITLVGEGFIVTDEKLKRADCVRQLIGTQSLQGRRDPRFVIDFYSMSEPEARTRYPAHYQYLLDHVRDQRAQQKRRTYAEEWWIFAEPRPALRRAVAAIPNYVVTVETSRHRWFTSVDSATLPEQTLVAIALDDPFFLGVLSSRVHVVFSHIAGARLGVGNDPRYTIERCFDRFPFPDPPAPLREHIRSLGEALDAHRKRQQQLHATLTITAIYNVLERLRAGEALSDKEKVVHDQALVSVLKQLHDDLDAAVFAAYGWPASLSDDEILERLLGLNAERAAEEKRGLIRWLRPEFQAPQSAQAAEQQEIRLEIGVREPAAASKEHPRWPDTLPQQLSVVRAAMFGDVASATARSLAKYFSGAKRKEVENALESLEALGIVVSAASGKERVWTALRSRPFRVRSRSSPTRRSPT
jgi:hypothetical protein